MLSALFGRRSQPALPAPASAAPAAQIEQRDAALLAAIDAIKRGEYGQVAASPDPVLRALADLAQHTQHAAGATLQGAVQQSLHNIDETMKAIQMFHDAKEVGERNQTIAAAAEELAITVSDIAARCQEASHDAHASVSAADEGSAVSLRAVEQMQGIEATVENTKGQVHQLSRASEEIGAIIGQIESIAGQTNMLALNATIEAARAGEAGRGFAIVAQEVKSLAHQTATATEDIRTRIASLQEAMAHIVQSMDQSSDAVKQGRDVISTLGDSISGVSARAGSTLQYINQITETLSQQRTAAQDVSRSIQSISDNTGSTQDALETLIAAIDHARDGIVAQVNGLMSQDIPNKVIMAAKMDHVLWRKRLAAMFIGKETLNPNELADHHSCRLGKWYDSKRGEPIAALPSFGRLEDPHRRVHAHGIAAARAYAAGRINEALAENEKVAQASEEVLALLDRLAEEARHQNAA